jgi:hypothetical protein
MNVENNNYEDNHIKLRIAIGSALVVAGASLVGPAMNRILQPEPAPQWAILLLVMGGIILITGLLILIVPSKHWKHIWQSVLGFPTWLREMYIWHKYGPKFILETPLIDYELCAAEQWRRYSSKVQLTVVVSEKTRKYCPVRVSFNNMTFRLEQRHGMIPLNAVLERNTLQPTEIVMNKLGKITCWMPVSWLPYDNPAVLFVDTQKPYTWVIKDIHVYLDNLQRYRKLSRKGWVYNAEKTQV